jgi:hypothetical protein
MEECASEEYVVEGKVTNIDALRIRLEEAT